MQVQRTLHAGRYRDAAAAVGGRRFEVANGERTIFEQYLAAIGSARRSIYLEHQALDVPEVVAALHGALGRGVEVVAVLPVAPERGPAPEVLEAFAALGACANFTLAGIAGLGADGLRKPVWVHSKLMLVDDAWATVGSANLHRWSMFGNGELNAAILSADAVRAFRVALLGEHLASDTSGLDDVAALRLFGRVARENRERRQRGEHDWQGLAVALDAATYGREGSPGW